MLEHVVIIRLADHLTGGKIKNKKNYSVNMNVDVGSLVYEMSTKYFYCINNASYALKKTSSN